MRELKLRKCSRVQTLHFSPDGHRLLAIGGAETWMVESAVWLDLDTGKNVGRIDQYALCYAVDPALTRYVVGGADEWTTGATPIQWTDLGASADWRPFPETAPKKKGPMPEFNGKFVVGMAFDSSGERLAICHGLGGSGLEYEVAVLRFDPPELLARVPTEQRLDNLVLSADFEHFAGTGGIDSVPSVELFHMATGKSLYRFDPPGTRTRSLLFLPGPRLAIANGRNVYVLPADRPEPLFVLEGHTGQVNAVALSRDNRWLLTASHDGAIRLWDADTGKPGPVYDWKVGSITAAAFAPDGLTCAIAGLRGKVVVWDVDE